MRIYCVFPSHEKAYIQDIIKEDSDFFVELEEENHMNSEKVLTEGHIMQFDMNDINGIIKKKEDSSDYSFNESHFTFLELYKENSLRSMMDDFIKRL